MVTKEFLQHPDAWRNEEIYKKIYEYSIANPEGYWEAQIDTLSWTRSLKRKKNDDREKKTIHIRTTIPIVLLLSILGLICIFQ